MLKEIAKEVSDLNMAQAKLSAYVAVAGEKAVKP